MELIVTESRPTLLSLSEIEAELLASLGRGLASTSAWWGDNGDRQQGSVVSVESAGVGEYRVTFRDVIGLVRLGGRQIRVEPKIPLRHFVFLASRSQLAPRLNSTIAHVREGVGFLELLAGWCVESAERLLRFGLIPDYTSYRDESPAVRGALLVPDTALHNLHGRAVAVCEFEELSSDAPLNRVVRAACEKLASMNNLSKLTRSRARRIVFRMDGVGRLLSADLRVKVDRLSSTYTRVLPLAKLVLAGCGISTSVGSKIGSTFLVRTPELIEDGYRTVLSQGLPAFDVAKRRLMLGGTGLSANPDVVFGANVAVGDVKYRFLARDWHRPDLNQVVAFATAFEASRGALFGFVQTKDNPVPRSVPMGRVRASCFAWLAADDVDPQESAQRICSSVAEWLAALPEMRSS